VGFIQKPFTMTELGRTVERVLQRASRRWRDSA
jgi:FixJ family two-component response regulator